MTASCSVWGSSVSGERITAQFAKLREEEQRRVRADLDLALRDLVHRQVIDSEQAVRAGSAPGMLSETMASS
jgi:hypothetical protein